MFLRREEPDERGVKQVSGLNALKAAFRSLFLAVLWL